jgi:hypothetical protein
MLVLGSEARAYFIALVVDKFAGFQAFDQEAAIGF